MLLLQHYDDGRNNPQSHKVSFGKFLYNKDAEELDKGKTWVKLERDGYNMFDLAGYGATRDEAVKDFEKKFYAFVNNVNGVLENWKNGDYSRGFVEINYLGNPVGHEGSLDI